MIRFTAPSVTIEAAPGEESRVVSGVAVPYNEIATVSDGSQVRFAPGSLPVDGKPPKLFMYHDASLAVGVVTDRVETDAGMLFSAKISRTALGNDALQLALDGVLDSVSVGVDPVEYTVEAETGVITVTKGTWLELSLVPIPAFAGATIDTVKASIHQDADGVSNNSDNTTAEESQVEETATPAAAPAEETIVPTAPIYAQAKREYRMPSAAEFLAAMHIGGDTWRNINAQYKEAANAQRTPLQAAAGDVLTTDTPGLLPVPVLGPLVQDLNFVRPVVNAVGARAYPDGGQQKTFIRPTITTHTSVAAQAAELNAVSATTMVIASNSVSRTTLAGQVTLSVQDIDFTSPAAMQLILNDLIGEYMIASDNFCADNLLAAANSSGVWDGTVADLMKSIYDAANDVSSGRNYMPTHMFVSVDVWSQMGQLVDGSNRPVFPFIGAGLTGFNSIGSYAATTWDSTPLGLQLVVDSNFAAKTMIITRVGTGVGDAFEFYEQQRGVMSIEKPDVLGRTMSYHGYVSTFAAISGMIRKITQA
jgi:HK97 family phage prohead protease